MNASDPEINFLVSGQYYHILPTNVCGWISFGTTYVYH